MVGTLRGKGEHMARDYIARDPRTGKPINFHKTKVAEASFEPIEGPWSALVSADAMSLAEGSLEQKEVRWLGDTHVMGKSHGVRALSTVPQSMVRAAHGLLLLALEDGDDEVRISALEVLPEFAVRRSEDLFDWLSVLLDDDSIDVSKAASDALARAAPTFPSGVQSSLENELRSPIAYRQKAAWKGLKSLADTWPEVVADHIDTLLLEQDVSLRRKAAGLLRKVLSRNSSAVWDLISWSLNDDDAQVRRTAAKTLPALARQDVRMATMFAERAIADTDSEVRLAAIKAIQKLDKDHGRARDLIVTGARSKDLRVRKACIDLLPRLMGEDELRIFATDLLKTETDEGLIKTLDEMRFDATLEGTEAQKNAALAPAIPVPEIDKEIAQAQGKGIGLLSTSKPKNLLERAEQQEAVQSSVEPKTPTVERRPSQDEIMGYMDDDEDEFDDFDLGPDEEMF